MADQTKREKEDARRFSGERKSLPEWGLDKRYVRGVGQSKDEREAGTKGAESIN